MIKKQLSQSEGTNKESMLRIRGVKTGYGSIQILNGIDLDVPKGGIVALLGGNGTGKSTLLKAVSGLLPTWEGEIIFDGHSIHSLRPDKIVRLGLVQVTQSKEVFPAMTVEENLRMGAYTNYSRGALKRNLARVYSYFPILEEKRRQLSATLSGGQLQMLCIGRGLMSEPKMLLLDEPSAALAPQVVLEILAIINRIRKDGMTVLLVEQNVRMALLLSEYGYIIRDGVISLKGESKKMINDEAVRLSYLGGTVTDTSEDVEHAVMSR